MKEFYQNRFKIQVKIESLTYHIRLQQLFLINTEANDETKALLGLQEAPIKKARG